MSGSYLHLFIFLVISAFISCVLFTIPFLISKRTREVGKYSSYECGMESDNVEVRKGFNIRFYIVAVVFLIFDVEIAFIIPWAASLSEIGWIGFWSMMLFLLILFLGFIYELHRGVLKW